MIFFQALLRTSESHAPFWKPCGTSPAICELSMHNHYFCKCCLLVPAFPKNRLALLRCARTSDSKTWFQTALKSVPKWCRFQTLPYIPEDLHSFGKHYNKANSQPNNYIFLEMYAKIVRFFSKLLTNDPKSVPMGPKGYPSDPK